MPVKTKPFHASDYLATPADVADFLSIALEDADPRILQIALREISRSEGMRQLASETGLNRELLDQSLAEHATPTIDTVYKVIHALGLRLALVPAENRANTTPAA